MERDRWLNRSGFIAAVLAAGHGLAGLAVFPALAVRHGGGAFFIAFFVALVAVGVPLLVLEFGLGQRGQAAAPGICRRAGSGWGFLGWWTVLTAGVLAAGLGATLAWLGRGLAASLDALARAELPVFQGDAQQFFHQQVQARSAGPDVLGAPAAATLAALPVVWLLVFLALCGGPPRYGRVAKALLWLALAAVLVLAAAAIAPVLSGGDPAAWRGLDLLLEVNLDRLTYTDPWVDAVTVVCLALALGRGVALTLASFLHKKEEIANNAYLCAFAGATGWLLLALMTAGLMGTLAAVFHLPVADAVAGGERLLFEVGPEAALAAGAPWNGTPAFAAVFFALAFVLGLGTLLGLAATVAAALAERRGWGRTRAAAATALAGLAGSALLSGGAGPHWWAIMEHWTLRYLLIAGALLVCVLAGWFGDARALRASVNAQSEVRLGWFFPFSVRWLVPAALLLVLVAHLMEDLRAHPAPPWAQGVFGWLLVGATLGAAVKLARRAPRPPEGSA